MSVTVGGSFIGVTVNVASSSFHKLPGSVALKVMVSLPYQSMFGMVIVAMRLMSIDTVRSVFPVYVQIISLSMLSESFT